MKFFAITMLLVCSMSMASASADIDWENGVIVLKNNEVLVGELTIQPAFEVVLFRSGEKSTFIPVREISYVNFRDKESQLVRKFIMMSTVHQGREIPCLYESLVTGKISVLRKPKGSTVPQLSDAYGYDYFVSQDSKLIEFANFKSTVYPTMAQLHEVSWLESYVQSERLDLHHPADIIRLVDFYNHRAKLTPWNGLLVKG